MRRREFVAVCCCSVCGISAGCLNEDDSEPVPEIVSLEVRNDQREEAHEFMVQIEDEDGIVFEGTYHLEAADPGESAVALKDPVESEAYTVRVEADGHSATVDTQDRITDDKKCIRLQFYLSAETLHSEYQLYDRCE
ncbi:hypothetical protein [Natrarchaeobaculum sulfurireducens]|uniref:Uncharacterized protein n=1 Tax=Natrarchaeobaculum sulfurireducens TaxID=2044521 RepID=A0A346PFU7_9EURY|nr:hypothetical protein [Natrarchaeobaculum sulfurireducens]AXR78392.1 hypothetical protein AArc1_2074 [Natrarchaeobaculum sulfurireducens]